jgi:hypothetical protein
LKRHIHKSALAEHDLLDIWQYTSSASPGASTGCCAKLSALDWAQKIVQA